MWMPAAVHVHAAEDDMLEGDTGLEEIPGGDWDAMLDGRSGKCGEKSTWVLSEDGTLTIGGSGALSDNSGYAKHKSNIKALVIGDKITEIGKNSFDGYTAIKGAVDLPASVKTIGASAFNGTKNISKIVINNAECKIADSANTFATSTILSGEAESTAKDYAKRYNRTFECISHKYGDWTTVKEATCTEAGSKKQVCVGCGDEQTQAIKALGHKYADTLSKDATNHWTECSVCHDKKDVTAHKYSGDKCSVCGYERVHTHKLTLVAAVGATCDKAGNTEYYTCSGCDKWFADDKGTKEIIDKKSVNVNALGHSYADAWNKDAENHWKECLVCHDKKDTASHTYNTDDTCDICGYERAHTHKLTLVEAVDATCDKEGSKAYYKCTGCDNLFEDAEGIKVIADQNTLVVKAKGHSMKYTEAVDATCTTDGAKAYYTCSACEKIYEDSKGNKEITDKDSLVVKASGHNYADTWSKDAYNHWKECSVCYEKKSAEAHTYSGDTCSVCGYEKAHVHNLETVAEVKATCTKSGNTSYYKCIGCDSWFEDAAGTKLIVDKSSVIVSALGHEYNADGKCKRCGQRNPELPDTLPSEIAFTKDKVTVDYTGNPVEDVMNYVEITRGEGELIFTYYLDEACTIPTYEGTVDEGNAPSNPGKYYAKVSITAYENYEAADAEGTCILVVRPRKVTGATVVNNKSTIKITWKKCKEADGYIIYRRKKGTTSSAYKAIKTIIGNETLSYSDGNIVQGNGYLYTIRAYADAADGTRVNGLMMSSAVKIVRTKVTSITNQNGSVKIKWTKVDGAAGYKVYRKSSGEDKYTRIQTIKNGKTNYYVDKSSKAIKNGKASYYYVKPYYEEDNGYVLSTNKKTNYYVSCPSITSVAGAKKAFTVKWKKNSCASGYEIRYSKSKSFHGYKTVTASGKNTVSKKIKNLTANKRYYVKVRTYKTYNGVKYYSAWSNVKNTKTK